MRDPLKEKFEALKKDWMNAKKAGYSGNIHDYVVSALRGNDNPEPVRPHHYRDSGSAHGRPFRRRSRHIKGRIDEMEKRNEILVGEDRRI